MIYNLFRSLLHDSGGNQEKKKLPDLKALQGGLKTLDTLSVNTYHKNMSLCLNIS
jgi:hypothetical protein